MEVTLIPMRTDNYTFLIHRPESKDIWVVDPSEECVVETLIQGQYTVHGVLNTHHHYDHVGGNDAIVKKWGCPVYGSVYDKDRIPGLTHAVAEGASIDVFGEKVRVQETPGHTLGALIFVFDKSQQVFVGDTLFSLGCGRLFEGTYGQMLASLLKIMSLPEDYKIYPGHEYTQGNTTFALSLGEPDRNLQSRIHEVRNLRLKDMPTIPSTVKMEWETNPFLQPIRKTRSVTEEAIQKFRELRLAKDEF